MYRQIKRNAMGDKTNRKMPTWGRMSSYTRLPAIDKEQTTGDLNLVATGTNIPNPRGDVSGEATKTRINSGRVGSRSSAREDKLVNGVNEEKEKRPLSAEEKQDGDFPVNSFGKNDADIADVKSASPQTTEIQNQSGSEEKEVPIIDASPSGSVPEANHPEETATIKTEREPNIKKDSISKLEEPREKDLENLESIMLFNDDAKIDEKLDNDMAQSFLRRDFLSDSGRTAELSIVSGKIPPSSIFETPDPEGLGIKALQNFVKLRDSLNLTGTETLDDLLLCVGVMAVSNDFTKNLAKNLNKFGIAEILGKVLRQNFTGKALMLTDSEEDKIKFQIINCASEVIGLLTGCDSSAFCESLLQIQMHMLLLHLLSEDLRLEGSNISIFNNAMLAPLLSMLAHLSRTTVGAECLIACGAQKILKQYCSRKVQLQVLSNEGDGVPPAPVAWSLIATVEILAAISLVNITDEEERATMNVTENMGLMLGMLFFSQQQGAGRHNHIFAILLLEALSRLAANDENSGKMIDHGVLQLLEQLLQPTASTELKTVAAQTVWNLAFKNRDAILTQSGCMKGQVTSHATAEFSGLNMSLLISTVCAL